MPVATAQSCSDALIRAWISRFGLPDKATSDNGFTFTAKLWSQLHQDLGTIVTYAPVYHPASVGHIESQHRSLKVGLKTALLKMADQEGKNWTRVLPWVLLGKRTTYLPALDASAAEVVYGQTLKVPGDLAGADLEPEGTIKQLLQKLHQKAAQPPVQTTHHTTKPTYTPSIMSTASHVYVRRGKTTPLGHNFEGPFPIWERKSESCVIVKVGTYVNGAPRLQLHHWNNLKPAHFLHDTFEAQAPTLGRPKKDQATVLHQ